MKRSVSIFLPMLLSACNGGSDSESITVAVAPLSATGAATAQAVKTMGGGSNGHRSASDPGVRGGTAGAGSALTGLTATELAAFEVGKEDFNEEEDVPDGLGPTMNLDSCGGCHQQPAIGGTSPTLNPQVAFASKLGATNTVPAFIQANGPVREARFVRNADGSADGGVHSAFTIAGRSDAAGCNARQPDFAGAAASGNLVFRIPTPVFGTGLIEMIPDAEILANAGRSAAAKRKLGIRGHGNFVLTQQTISAQPNRNGNDGTLGRFGWKAQNKSLLVFSGEAYNVEMGITNDLFQTERDESASCAFATLPNSVTDLDAATPLEALSSIEKFVAFMRSLAPPTPSADQPGGADSITRGKELFASTGCSLCHTPTLHTGNSTRAAMRQRDVNLYSDLLLHDMGSGLADGISQGQANEREFRTAPLWGLGQRVFFLHDGRTSDLVRAIDAHRSSGSEANEVIDNYSDLRDDDQQHLLNFLRSL